VGLFVNNSTLLHQLEFALSHLSKKAHKNTCLGSKSGRKNIGDYNGMIALIKSLVVLPNKQDILWKLLELSS